MVCAACVARARFGLAARTLPTLRQGARPLSAQRYWSSSSTTTSRPLVASSSRSTICSPGRSYATIMPSSQTSTPPPPLPLSSRPKLNITPPSLSAIRSEGYFDEDIALIPPDQASIDLTPATIRQLAQITARETPEVLAKGLALRVGVDNGGCHGYQYVMALTEERGVDDYVMQPVGVNCIPVVVDLLSLKLIKGSTLHYGSELIGSSFQLMNNPQAKQGGSCGCGVSWEAKEDI